MNSASLKSYRNAIIATSFTLMSSCNRCSDTVDAAESLASFSDMASSVEPVIRDSSLPQPSEDDLRRKFGKTEFARSCPFPGNVRIIPGTAMSTILFPKTGSGSSPGSEDAAGMVLHLDNETGEIITPPGESWRPLETKEMVDIALSDIVDGESKAFYNSLEKDVSQVPGLAVVTFRASRPPTDSAGMALAPAFLLRVWIDTKNKSIFRGELGN